MSQVVLHIHKWWGMVTDSAAFAMHIHWLRVILLEALIDRANFFQQPTETLFDAKEENCVVLIQLGGEIY